MARATALAALTLVLGCGSSSQVGPDAPAARRPPPVWTADGQVLGVERRDAEAPVTYASIVAQSDPDEPVYVQLAPGWSLERPSNDVRHYPSTTVTADSPSPSDLLAPAREQACVGFAAEARFRNHAHDHIVRLLSRCQKTVLCAVTTDVNPRGVEVEVRPSEHVEVLTFRGSPAREFEARVACAWGQQSPRPE
jgi:hypothetical protein